MRSVALVLAVLWSGACGAAEQIVPAERIVDGLAGASADKPLVRGLAGQTRGARPIEAIRVDRLRELDAAGEGGLSEDAAAAARAILGDLRLKAIDLPVAFAFGSAAVSDAGYRQLNALGVALTSGRLRQASFIVAGHTDAVGSRAANRRLSKRRADAVRDYLVSTFRIEPSRLIALGFGETMLKDEADGAATVNRRVEVQAFLPQ